MELLLHGKPHKVEQLMAGKPINFTFEGVIDKFTRKYIMRDLKTLSERTQKLVAPFMTVGPCFLCKGARLSPAALSCKIHGYNIAELAAMEVGELIEVIPADRGPGRRADGAVAARAASAM